jgi:hypothetical protein
MKVQHGGGTNKPSGFNGLMEYIVEHKGTQRPNY